MITYIVLGFLVLMLLGMPVAFAIGIAISVLSAIAIWQASPGKVRAVAGQMHKVQGRSLG